MLQSFCSADSGAKPHLMIGWTLELVIWTWILLAVGLGVGAETWVVVEVVAGLVYICGLFVAFPSAPLYVRFGEGCCLGSARQGCGSQTGTCHGALLCVRRRQARAGDHTPHLEPAVHQLLRQRPLAQQAVAGDEGVPQLKRLQLLDGSAWTTDQARESQLCR